MAMTDALLTVGATAIAADVKALQLHTTAPNASGVGGELGSRVAVTGASDADGDITWAGAWTGLTPGATVWGVTYWTATSAGTYRGNNVRTTGDSTVNAAGEFNYTATETGVAS